MSEKILEISENIAMDIEQLTNGGFYPLKTFLNKDQLDSVLTKMRLTNNEVWPVNSRYFFVIRDDCPSGVKIMRAEESKQSSRIMARAGKPYYEYRDTAMSTGTKNS